MNAPTTPKRKNLQRIRVEKKTPHFKGLSGERNVNVNNCFEEGVAKKRYPTLAAFTLVYPNSSSACSHFLLKYFGCVCVRACLHVCLCM